MSTRNILVAGGVVIILAGLFYAFNAYIYEEKQGEGNTYEPYRGTLTGEYVCLPKVNADSPETEECIFGLKTDVGEYYALDFNLFSQEGPTLSMGNRITAAGLITPIERLSTDHWRQYPVKGIFSVTDSLQVTN